MRKTQSKGNRIKRKNQTSRMRAQKAKKSKSKSFIKKKMLGEIIVKDEIQPMSKSLWPNQAQPQ